MRKDKRKLVGLLLAIACVSCGAGGVIAGGNVVNATNITAKAETTTCVMSQIGALNSSTASVIQAYSKLETEKPAVNSWSYKFTFEEGSGRGFLYNGEAHTGWTMKQPGRDMYIELGKTASVGDYVIIDGSFYNADSDTRLTFSCKFQWNGEKWVDYVEEDAGEDDSSEDNTAEYTTYTVTKIGANRDSSATVAYIYSLGGDELPKAQGNWQNIYSLASGASVKLNNTVLSVGAIKLPGDLYIPLNATAVAGDILTINGAFYNDDNGIMLVFENCQLQFNGEKWVEVAENPDPAMQTYELGTLTFKDWTADKNHIYLRGTKANGSIPNPDDGSNGWNAQFSWAEGCVTLNGEVIKGFVVKYPGEFFMSFPKAPKVGDVLTIKGTFYNEAVAIAYVVDESSFTWDGETWIPVLAYTDYAIENLAVYNTQNQNNSLALKKEDGSAFGQNGAFAFLGGSGSGFLLNGETIDGKQITISDDKLTLNATFTAKEGDVLTIGGTFYNVESASRYIIEESNFIYQDGAWKVYESNYTEIGIGEVKAMEEISLENYLYLAPVNSVESPDCDGTFVCVYGTGVTLNGQVLQDVTIEWFDNCLIVTLPSAAEEGDVFAIDGKFLSETDGVMYYVKESQCMWNGYAWESVIDYQVQEVGKLLVSGNNTTAGQFKTTASDLSSEVFDLTLESGVGFTVNGKAAAFTAKNAAGIITFTFDEVEIGSIVKIGGTFYNRKQAVKYVIEESEFVWDGTAWTIKYFTINVGALKIRTSDTNSQDLYLAPVDSTVQMTASGWSSPLHCAGGNGITVNGTVIDMKNTVKVPNNGMFFVRLTSSADGVANGSVVVIEGKFRCEDSAIEYIIEESIFVYNNGAWTNQLDEAKSEKLTALQAHFASFAESDYYATEWALMQKTFADAKTAINSASVKSAVEKLFNDATALMDLIATKAEWDADASAIKADAKAELENYKDATLYREIEQTALAGIIAQAKSDIDGSANWADLYEIIADAKADMDGLKTDAEWDLAEAFAESAKAEIEEYKAMENYLVNEQSKLQEIIAKANADIDAQIGNETAIAEIVASAKAQMDAVPTAEQVESGEMAVLIAKAELEDYKSQSDYNRAEWSEIQSILAQAFADLDKAIGDDEAIANIVANAKASMDKVSSSGAESDESTDSESTGSDESADSSDDEQTSASDDKKDKKSGCSGVVSGVASGAALLGVAAVLLKKKRED